jgi:hypothetical protein
MKFIIVNHDVWQSLFIGYINDCINLNIIENKQALGGNRRDSTCKDSALMMHRQLLNFLLENHAGHQLFCII